MDKAKVLKTDIMASNGVIHVIDSVIIPSSSGSHEKVYNQEALLVVIWVYLLNHLNGPKEFEFSVCIPIQGCEGSVKNGRCNTKN